MQELEDEDNQKQFPFCQRVYDGEKNECYFPLEYDLKEKGMVRSNRCVYCGGLKK